MEKNSVKREVIINTVMKHIQNQDHIADGRQHVLIVIIGVEVKVS